MRKGLFSYEFVAWLQELCLHGSQCLLSVQASWLCLAAAREFAFAFVCVNVCVYVCVCGEFVCVCLCKCIEGIFFILFCRVRLILQTGKLSWVI